MSEHRRPWSFLSRATLAAGLLAALLTASIPGTDVRSAPASEAKPAEDAALERARERVKMLDDLYKNAVVSITTRYVAGQGKQPAIMVAQDIFGAMGKHGWHSAKLVDATGEPMNDDNSPKTKFEKDAATAINSGKPYFDRVVGEGKERKLLAATVVPVVMQRCANCHSNKKVGEVLGFIRYELPIK